MVILQGTYAQFKLMLALFAGAKVGYALSRRSGTDASGGQAGVIEAYVWSASAPLFMWRIAPSGSPAVLPTEATFTTDQAGSIKADGALWGGHGSLGT